MLPFCSCSTRFYQTIPNSEWCIGYIAVGSILTQEHASVHKPIAILTKMLINSHKSYSVHYCELLEIVTYCKAWCLYIDRQWRIVIMDYKPLIQLYTWPLLNKRQLKRIDTLSQYPILFFWQLFVAFVVLETLYWHCPIKNTFSSNPNPNAPPTATLYTILVEKSLLIRLFAAYFNPKNS